MANNPSRPVFDQQTEVPTAQPVPQPGSDCRIDVNCSEGAWNNGIIKTSFLKDLSDGQEQDVIRTADHVVQAHKNQIVSIGQAQRTTAREEITITSTENQVYVKGATQIVLEVGKSKITMTPDGRIEIAGVEITLTGDVILSNATQQNTIVGGRVDVNP